MFNSVIFLRFIRAKTSHKLTQRILFCTSKHILSATTQIKKTQKLENSINPLSSQAYAYGHFFPKQWDTNKIRKILDPSNKNIQTIQIIKNRVGEPTGKVMISFLNEKTMSNYIEKYNQDFLITQEQTQRIVILPFGLRTRQMKKQNRKNLKLDNPVRVSNLDFDITERQLKKIADDYGKVTHIDMFLRQSGINRGFATVYFEKKQEAQSFINFINGFLYKERKLTAFAIVQSKKSWRQQAEEKYLDVPNYTIESNQKLKQRILLEKSKYEKNLIRQ